MAATSQPISIARDQRNSSGPSFSSHLAAPSLYHPSFPAHPSSPMHISSSSSSSLLAHQLPTYHLANPRYAGTSPRSAESSTSWSIHPGPLFVSAGSLGSTSGSLGASSMVGSAGSFRKGMYPGVGCSPMQVLNPLEPDFKFRGIVGSMESDHGSLINPHMSEREVEQYRNFTCCGMPLNDLHAVIEHFETSHVLLVDPLQPQSTMSSLPHHHQQLQQQLQQGQLAQQHPGASSPTQQGVGQVPTSNDSSLAGALGPERTLGAHHHPQPSHVNTATAAATAAGFDLDDIDMEMDPEPEHDQEQGHSGTSPSPSASSSNSNTSNSSNPNVGACSNRGSPLSGGAGPLPLTQPQRFASAQTTGTNGTTSSVSSPPDTPLLTTPVSPFASAAALGSGMVGQGMFFGQGQGQEGGLIGLASNIQNGIGILGQQGQGGLQHGLGQNQNQLQQIQSQAQNPQQVPTPSGPAAFDNVHLPVKQLGLGLGGGIGAMGGMNGMSGGMSGVGMGMFTHPYAGAAARRHPMSPLSSASGGTGTGNTTPSSPSPASATSTSTSTSTGWFPPGAHGHGHSHGHGLHHTQSLCALRLARHITAERERERERDELVKRAMNRYAGYEDYSRGFPGTGEVGQQASSLFDGDAGVDMNGMRMGGGAGVGMGVGPTESAIHPGLLFANNNNNANANGNGNAGVAVGVKTEPVTARTTPAPSRSGSPSASGPTSIPASASTSTSTPSSSSTQSQPRKPLTASTTVPRPSSSLLLSKPFKCPTPGCTKSYKQANGLKYHVTHGQCSFTPPPELSSISELGLSIGVNLKLGPMGLEGLEGMSEKERRDAEREAERRLRPFCCQVKPCTRRYKNMNGLRYHYQHSGEHGAIGLRMLAEGRHDATRSQSLERSDEEEENESQGQREGSGERGGTRLERTNSTERGRRRERKENQNQEQGQAQTSSAPSTPGPSQSQAQRSPFTTQAFGFSHLQHKLQHQRSLSGSSGGQQQPRSPLSQQFPAPSTPSFQSPQFASPTIQNPNQTQNNQFANVAPGMNGGMNGMNCFAFAVQSQPASAYASPWGSRAGSPTSTSASQQQQWPSPAGQGQGSEQGQQGQGGDAMMS